MNNQKVLDNAFKEHNKRRADRGLPLIDEKDLGITKQMILKALTDDKLTDNPKIWCDIAPYVDRDPTLKTLSGWITKVTRKRDQGDIELSYYESWIISHL